MRFRLVLETAAAGDLAIAQLRRALKRLRRGYGLRCIDAAAVSQDEKPDQEAAGPAVAPSQGDVT